jgi:hypothetical protein
VIGLSKDDLRMELRAQLETATRERLRVEDEKSAAVKAFNAELKDIDDRIRSIVLEIDGCKQQALPFGGPESENG